MKKHWRFRSGWRGKLILQRYVEWIEYDSHGGDYLAATWRDATTNDLLDYYLEHDIRQT